MTMKRLAAHLDFRVLRTLAAGMAVLLIAFTAAFFAGCKGQNVEPEYMNGELSCGFRGRLNGVEVAGELWVSAKGNGTANGNNAAPDSTPNVRNGVAEKPSESTGTAARIAPGRDLSVKFSSPESLACIEISRRQGNLAVSSGDVALTGLDAGDWLAIPAALFPEGTACDVSEIPGCAGQLRVIFSSAPDTEVIIDTATGQPVAVRGESMDIELFSAAGH